jgi:hypothetical protein
MVWVIDQRRVRRQLMRRPKRRLTLGDVIRTVSQFSHDDHEVSLVVADLINRRLIRLRGKYKHSQVTCVNR